MQWWIALHDLQLVNIDCTGLGGHDLEGFKDYDICIRTDNPTCGNSQSKTKRLDDRLSLERAQHELKKKYVFALTSIVSPFTALQ